MIFVQQHAPEDDPAILDRVALWDRQEKADLARKRSTGRTPKDKITALLKCSFFLTGVAMLGGGYAAKFWRSYPEIRAVIDVLEPGVDVNDPSIAWRAKVARANGYRWVPFPEIIDQDEFLQAAGRA